MTAKNTEAKAKKVRSKGKASASAAGKTAKRTGKPQETHGKPEKPGRVVATGADVPSLDDVLKAPEKREREEMGGPGAGRPVEYLPHFTDVARGMCRLGATDFDLAQEFETTTVTIWRWRSKYPEFCNALNEGKEVFDDRIERSLAMRAAGYSFHTEKVFSYNGAIVRAQTVEHCPPDVGAIKLWLSNRRPDQWRDKQEVKLDGSNAFLAIWKAIGDGTAAAALGG